MNKQAQSVKIKGFKGFEDFSLEGLKRVNLIGGKNNIGKTAFMEAMRLYLESQEPYDVVIGLFEMVKRRRGHLSERESHELYLDFFYCDGKSFEIQVDDSILRFSYYPDGSPTRIEDFIREVSSNQASLSPPKPPIEPGPVFEILLNGDGKIVHPPLFSRISTLIHGRDFEQTPSIHFISSATADEKQIAILYGSLINENKESYLDESLRLFDESLIALKQVVTRHGVLLKLLTKQQEKPVLLSSFGEGINRYIAILCAIWASKDGYLFIDEVENGIHYSNYQKLWKLLFEASKLANCQLFLSTHSKECIEAFNAQNSENEGAYFEFYRHHKKQNIVAKSRDFKQLNYALTHDGAIRGE